MSGAITRISSMKTIGLFLRKGTCSETLFHVVNHAYGHPMPAEERASAMLAGGILMQGYQCGQIWGAALAAGARACRVRGTGADGQAGAIEAARRVFDAFRTRSPHTDCFDIIHMSGTPSHRQLLGAFLKGRYARCFAIIARYPPLACAAIDGALAERAGNPPAAPVGCAAALARRMGASDTDTTIAAGLAGGIGLSGGACGALAAAIWLTTVRRIRQGDAQNGLDSSRAHALLDRFLKGGGYEFECSKLAGRTFASVDDHARYVAGGGCSKILDALAAP